MCMLVCVILSVQLCFYHLSSVLSVRFFCLFFSIVFSACYHWWICFLVWLLSSFFLSLPFLLSRVADRALLLWPGVRPELLRWESRVQDIRTPETSRPHVISIGESSPRDLHLSAKTQLHPMASKLQCWAPHAKQLARQEHNPTH